MMFIKITVNIQFQIKAGLGKKQVKEITPYKLPKVKDNLLTGHVMKTLYREVG